MKRLLAALVIVALGGCSTLQNVGTGISLVTKSVANPVTKAEEAQIELAIDAAITVLRGYKKACAEGTADKECRGNIAAIQRYTKQMPTLIVQLRTLVDSNQQLNAIVVYNQLTALYANFKTAAAGLGYNVGAMP